MALAVHFIRQMTAKCAERYPWPREITVEKDNQTTLIVRDRKSRQVVITQTVADQTAALALFHSLGDGFDAEIRTPKYTTLILSLE